VVTGLAFLYSNLLIETEGGGIWSDWAVGFSLVLLCFSKTEDVKDWARSSSWNQRRVALFY